MENITTIQFFYAVVRLKVPDPGGIPRSVRVWREGKPLGIRLEEELIALLGCTLAWISVYWLPL
jgi:hypothetical protein